MISCQLRTLDMSVLLTDLLMSVLPGKALFDTGHDNLELSACKIIDDKSGVGELRSHSHYQNG